MIQRLAARRAAGCWDSCGRIRQREVLAVGQGELVGFDEGLSMGELDDKVLAVGELVGNNERG